MMRYPRSDNHRHRGMVPGASTETVDSTTSSQHIPPHAFAGGALGANGTLGGGYLPHHRDKYAFDRASPLLPYKYSPLEYSSILDTWQIPAAANGLAEVVLGEPGNLGEAGTTQSKTYRLAVKRTVMSVVASLLFGLGTMAIRGKESGLEFIAGYLVEQSLSEYNDLNQHPFGNIHETSDPDRKSLHQAT